VVAADTAAVVVAADVAIIPTVAVATKRSRFEPKQKYTKPSAISAGGFLFGQRMIGQLSLSLST
jgi:hypothetical protein